MATDPPVTRTPPSRSLRDIKRGREAGKGPTGAPPPSPPVVSVVSPPPPTLSLVPQVPQERPKNGQVVSLRERMQAAPPAERARMRAAAEATLAARAAARAQQAAQTDEVERQRVARLQRLLKTYAEAGRNLTAFAQSGGRSVAIVAHADGTFEIGWAATDLVTQGLFMEVPVTSTSLTAGLKSLSRRTLQQRDGS